ncbi:hypothetical protein [Aristophania vespae]|uniref:hypothetical protein n=1 Tax=Aristophania vespae TaxID=2697033 RepID=UPI0023519239|nr:hypothetical protein [Aristophania vespae]UMM63114.1 hypothetical protein DM15PD_00680 [Aristophania vespae]
MTLSKITTYGIVSGLISILILLGYSIGAYLATNDRAMLTGIAACLFAIVFLCTFIKFVQKMKG